MKISEAKKGLRVRLTDKAREPHKGSFSDAWRVHGTLTSGRVLPSRGKVVEGLYVRVKWDAMPTPESWDLTDLEPVKVQL